MSRLAITLVMAITLPTLGFAQTYPTTNSKSGTISGDINGDINGNLGASKKQYRTIVRPQKACHKDSNGIVRCKPLNK